MMYVYIIIPNYNQQKPCVLLLIVQTSGLSVEVTASSSADLAEIEQIVKDRMVNFESEHFCVDCRRTD